MVRGNGYLFLLMLGLAALGVYGALRNDGAEASKTMPAPRAAEAGGEEVGPVAGEVRATESERARALIEKHEAALQEHPRSPDAPGLLSAMGNLYRQKLRDYAKAAQCYERLLYDYPTWEGTRRAYIQLVACYEALGNEESLRTTYRRMMEAFPPESQEHLYAKTKLGL